MASLPLASSLAHSSLRRDRPSSVEKPIGSNPKSPAVAATPGVAQSSCRRWLTFSSYLFSRTAANMPVMTMKNGTTPSKRPPLKSDGARPPVELSHGLSNSASGQPTAASIARRACLTSASRIHSTDDRLCSGVWLAKIISRCTLFGNPPVIRSMTGFCARAVKRSGSKPASPAISPVRCAGATSPGFQRAARAGDSVDMRTTGARVRAVDDA
mmetsp:Transcript_7654/g.18475  ORF Transcript_7654/g.18475 Transcript_7654/m.18475 type:complete len:213 (-) Transcript_7654:80-718(-)